MNPSKHPEINTYLAGLTDFQRELVLGIREVVLSTDEQVKEGIKWGSIAFFNQKNICGYRVAKGHVTLLFMEGASLNDTHNILNGTGAKARTIKVTKPEEIPTEGIRDLVRQSLAAGM